MSKLDEQLGNDENLWRMWCEEGVTESTPLAVDVFFYAAKRDRAEAIAHALQSWGLRDVKISSKRTLLIFKGWLITGIEDGTWSLDKLKDRSRRYVRLTEVCPAVYDGCGATMPS